MIGPQAARPPRVTRRHLIGRKNPRKRPRDEDEVSRRTPRSVEWREQEPRRSLPRVSSCPPRRVTAVPSVISYPPDIRPVVEHLSALDTTTVTRAPRVGGKSETAVQAGWEGGA